MSKTEQYINFVKEIKSEIRKSRYLAFSSSNSYMIELYWYIGKQIALKQKEAGWGNDVIKQLSLDLTKEFDGKFSFSADNLHRMKQLYIEYSNIEVLGQPVPKLQKLIETQFLGQAVPKLTNSKNESTENQKNDWEEIIKKTVALVPWGHNILIIKKCKTIEERLFYIENTFRFAWKRDTLLNQIKMQAYRRTKFDKIHNFDNTLADDFAEQASESIKSSYNLEFLNIKKPVNELLLENKLVENIKQFLLELGYGFCFIGQQYRLVFDGKEYFIDLLFYHRFLKALVAIELKTGDFEPEYAGKLDFYLNVLNHCEKAPDDNPAIGIIFCADHSKLEVEFSLKTKQNPIGVADYQLVKTLPDSYKGKFPSKRELKKIINL